MVNGHARPCEKAGTGLNRLRRAAEPSPKQLRKPDAGWRIGVGTVRSGCRLRHSNGDCDMCTPAAKTECGLRNPFAGCENRMGTAKSVCRLRKPNADCEICLPAAKAECGLRNLFAR